jgi:proteasome lid subunit RPN8/RPN11
MQEEGLAEKTGVSIPAHVLARMHAHLVAGYPHEACGILIGEALPDGADARPHVKVVHDVVLVANVWSVESASEGQHNRYLISPEDVARADRLASTRGLDIVGFFHSHPDHPARPSETDREFAWPVISFVIVAVEQGCVSDTRSWVLRDDRSGFDEERVDVTG